MISATNIFIKYGDRVLLDSVNLLIKEKDRIGLVGRNGAGKSTMLKILSGMMLPHEGSITRPNESSLGFLHQEMNLPQGRTVMEETLRAFEATKQLEKRIAEINDEIARRTDYESLEYAELIQDFSDLNDRFQLMGGGSVEADTEKVLKGLGFQQSDFDRQTTEFSGGWQMRIELAKMLLQQPDYLLLDEPTNHLDIESILWLESFLKDYPGAIIVISHDKQFLDNVTRKTVEVELGKLYEYKAPYSEYIELRKDRREKQIAAYQNQQKVIAQRERTITRFMAKASKTKMAQSMQKQLDKMERIEIDPEDAEGMNLRFPPAPRSGDIVVDAKQVEKSYGDLLVLDGVDLKLDRGDRVAFVGQNGQGKTTLAKILINELPASGGDIRLGHNVQVGYYAQNQSESLHPNQTLLETMEAASPPEMRTRLRNILGAFMFSGEDADKKVSVLSGGERARLALACLLLRPFNLLVLDEPTNHLDMISKDILKDALLQFDGTLIVVSHDREFLAGLTNRTIEFRDHQLFDHLGDVNYFLEKRALDNMRDVEKSSSDSAAPPHENAAPKREVSFEERKRLLRNVQNAEKKIERMEKELKKMEAKMAEEGFYEQPDATAYLQKYQETKKDLDVAMEEWEDAQMQWEEVADD
jgi:ATP-binding cassette subfamily F protein 3